MECDSTLFVVKMAILHIINVLPVTYTMNHTQEHNIIKNVYCYTRPPRGKWLEYYWFRSIQQANSHQQTIISLYVTGYEKRAHVAHYVNFQ